MAERTSDLAFWLQFVIGRPMDGRDGSVIPPDDGVGTDGRSATETDPLDGLGPADEAGPRAEAGPLGRTDPAPGRAVPRAPATATAMVVVGFAGLVASLVVLGSIAEGVRDQEVFPIDAWATSTLHGLSSPGLDVLMSALTAIASSVVLTPIFVVVVALLIRNHRYGAALFLTVAGVGSLVIQATMKVFFERPRPQLDWVQQALSDYSFPSGHTMNAVIFYVALALILWSVFGRRVGRIALAAAIAIAIGVGLSRIYLGFHYLTDVVGGILAGIVWLLVVGAAFRARPAWWRWGIPDAPNSPGTRRPEGPGPAAVR